MKARKRLLIVAALGLSTAHLAPVLAVADEDFSRYTNEELVQKRAQVREMSDADRELFRAEMQKRSQAMSREERESLGIGGPRRGAADEQGNREGDAQKEPQRKRASEDNEQGQGELRRERQRAEDVHGYGRGYESRQRDVGGRPGDVSRQGGGGRRGGG